MTVKQKSARHGEREPIIRSGRWGIVLRGPERPPFYTVIRYRTPEGPTSEDFDLVADISIRDPSVRQLAERIPGVVPSDVARALAEESLRPGPDA